MTSRSFITNSSYILLAFCPIILAGCNTLKETHVSVASGNYERAIRNAVDNLRKSKTKKKSQEYILLLEEAFAKAVDRDLRNIDRYRIEDTTESLESTYRAYVELRARQDYIRPLLPLYLPDQGRDAEFRFDNYDNEILVAKANFSERLYDQAKSRLEAGDKYDARIAYDNFNHLLSINPNYRDAGILASEAQYKGTDFVQVSLANDTGVALPQRLEKDLLDFEAYKLNSRWTVYHSAPIENIEYDYEMLVVFRSISVSPDHIHERALVKERRIKDGFEYELDANGNVLKDESGNDIKRDRYITVHSSIIEFRQTKSVRITADVEFRPYLGDEVFSRFPVSSEFVFNHEYCSHSGDARALDDHYRRLVANSQIAFPTSEQMIYDTGEDLKKRLREIVAKNRF